MADLHDIETLIDRGKKIEAIKEYRALTGVGLREAKDAVEQFQAHRQWPAETYRDGAPTSEPPSQAAGGGPLAEIEQLVAQGKLIHAIKELRARTGWGLKDSKEAVDARRAHGSWPADVLAALGRGHEAGPSSAAAPTARPSDRNAALEAVAQHLGYAPDVHLAAPARRSGHDGHLVMLRDRACFVHDDRGRSTVSVVIPYDAVTRSEVDTREGATLYVSTGQIHERFELGAAEADAALALLRVFGR